MVLRSEDDLRQSSRFRYIIMKFRLINVFNSLYWTRKDKQVPKLPVAWLEITLKLNLNRLHQRHLYKRHSIRIPSFSHKWFRYFLNSCRKWYLSDNEIGAPNAVVFDSLTFKVLTSQSFLLLVQGRKRFFTFRHFLWICFVNCCQWVEIYRSYTLSINDSGIFYAFARITSSRTNSRTFSAY